MNVVLKLEIILHFLLNNWLLRLLRNKKKKLIIKIGMLGMMRENLLGLIKILGKDKIKKCCIYDFFNFYISYKNLSHKILFFLEI